MPSLTLHEACAPPTLRELCTALPERPPRFLTAAIVTLMLVVFGGAAVVLGGASTAGASSQVDVRH